MMCVFLQECVRDTLSPISINLSFLQVNSESSQAVLNVDSRRQLHMEVRALGMLYHNIHCYYYHYSLVISCGT